MVKIMESVYIHPELSSYPTILSLNGKVQRFAIFAAAYTKEGKYHTHIPAVKGVLNNGPDVHSSLRVCARNGVGFEHCCNKCIAIRGTGGKRIADPARDNLPGRFCSRKVLRCSNRFNIHFALPDREFETHAC